MQKMTDLSLDSNHVILEQVFDGNGVLVHGA